LPVYYRHMAETVLTVTNLKKSYGDFQAVRGVSFAVKSGEVFGILGPNGAGKTSTLEMIEGLRDITEGTVVLDGLNVATDTAAVKKIIGVQLQASAFFPNLSLVELLRLFRDLYGAESDPMELLREVSLEEKAGAQVKELSGGQKQRFSIAAALVNDPVVLFLDEPTTGLDPQARRNLWDLVQQIRAKGTTIVLTTHYMEEAEVLCHRVAIMDEGKIISMDTPDSLKKALIGRGFKPHRQVVPATLEDVFIDLTGKELRD
jgi:ABC-2 type transport system ATP-binding protein